MAPVSERQRVNPVSILPGPDSVLHMTEVTVRRTPAVLLDAVGWNVEVDQRWVILGPNGAGKTTLLQVAAGHLFPTSGRVHILGERLGAVDVGELRPRIGLSSAALAGRVPPQERVLDVVVSAGYGVVGRWRESYDDLDFDRGRELLAAMGIDALPDEAFASGAVYPTDWLDTAESQELLRYQRHSFDDITAAVAASAGWRRPLVAAVSPLARAYLLRMSPYYRARTA